MSFHTGDFYPCNVQLSVTVKRHILQIRHIFQRSSRCNQLEGRAGRIGRCQSTVYIRTVFRLLHRIGGIDRRGGYQTDYFSCPIVHHHNSPFAVLTEQLISIFIGFRINTQAERPALFVFDAMQKIVVGSTAPEMGQKPGSGHPDIITRHVIISHAGRPVLGVYSGFFVKCGKHDAIAVEEFTFGFRVEHREVHGPFSAVQVIFLHKIAHSCYDQCSNQKNRKCSAADFFHGR